MRPSARIFWGAALLFIAGKIAALPAFPGAEGFGAEETTGGRDGRVIYVTNLDATGPGSLNEALAAPGPKYILFKVGGVVSGGTRWLEMTWLRRGDATIAGQTAPGGIIVQGLYSNRDTPADAAPHQRDNVIIRHLRSRGAMDQDSLRLLDIQNVVVDHSSFAGAADECVQISYAQNFTIQNSIFAETPNPDHWDRGGVLITYSDGPNEYPLDNIGLHHNMWHRIGGRLPVMQCQQGDCAGRIVNVEVSDNLVWDPYYTMAVLNGLGVNNNEGDDSWFNMNLVNNFWFVRSDPAMPDQGWEDFRLNVSTRNFPAGFIGGVTGHARGASGFPNGTGNSFFFSGNRMSKYPGLADLQLAYANTDFFIRGNHPYTGPYPSMNRSSRHDFPPITHTPTEQVMQRVVDDAGAFPRDPTENRYIGWVRKGIADATPADTWDNGGSMDPTHWQGVGVDPQTGQRRDDFLLPGIADQSQLDGLRDSDADGMPDYWETANGLDPHSTYAPGTPEEVKEHNQIGLSLLYTGMEGYANLEVYLNRLAEYLVDPSVPMLVGRVLVPERPRRFRLR
jgi:hypothetical protein